MTNSILQRTIDIIVEKTDLERDAVKPDTVLATLDIDSIDLAEVIFELEEQFDIEIDMSAADAWERLKTISDIADAVSAHVAKQN